MVIGIAELLNVWQSVGVFDYMLPFLLIFAVIFGVLGATNILGSNKGVHVIIALTISLMALQLGFVQAFFKEVFPRLGVAIAAIIVVVILAALFIPDPHKRGWLTGFAVAGVVFGLIAILNSFTSISWFGSSWWDQYWGLTVGAILLILVIVAMFVWNTPKSAPGVTTQTPFRT